MIILKQRLLRPSRFIIFLGVLLGHAGLAACGLQPSPDSPTSTPPVRILPAPTAAATGGLTPTPTGSAVATGFVPPTPTPLSGNIYLNEDYRFTFEIPQGWALEEGAFDELANSIPYIYLTKDTYRITVHYKTVFEDVRIGPSGLGQGELAQTDAVPILDRETAGYRLESEGKTKMVLYMAHADELRLFAGLDLLTGPGLDYSYEEIDIPAEIQAEFRTVLQSLSRIGDKALPESVALLADFPLILPMEKFYYSQIYDTDVANACGPAAALMVLDYYGLEDSMDTVIEQLQSLPSPGAYDPDCYINTVCTSPEALTMLFFDRGLSVFPHEDWTLDEVFAVVSRGHPIIADILWDPQTESLGHFVVIYGVDLDRELLYYHDPYRGQEMVTPWDEF
ncbi:MAG: C39 family peptidase, partial [Anaerolineales bacterium]|nr:C39 family peptidase [Anaerolineales bacterium]